MVSNAARRFHSKQQQQRARATNEPRSSGDRSSERRGMLPGAGRAISKNVKNRRAPHQCRHEEKTRKANSNQWKSAEKDPDNRQCVGQNKAGPSAQISITGFRSGIPIQVGAALGAASRLPVASAKVLLDPPSNRKPATTGDQVKASKQPRPEVRSVTRSVHCKVEDESPRSVRSLDSSLSASVPPMALGPSRVTFSNPPVTRKPAVINPVLGREPAKGILKGISKVDHERVAKELEKCLQYPQVPQRESEFTRLFRNPWEYYESRRK